MKASVRVRGWEAGSVLDTRQVKMDRFRGGPDYLLRNWVQEDSDKEKNNTK